MNGGQAPPALPKQANYNIKELKHGAIRFERKIKHE